MLHVFNQLMNKRFLIFHLVFFVTCICCAQPLESFNTKRLDLNKKGMIVLGSWALANLAASPILASRSNGSRKHFHQMNGYWNTVNAVLAGIGYYSASTNDPTGLLLSETLQAQHAMEKILLFNAGLDLAYLAGGLYLQQRAKSSRRNSDRLKGFGQSLVLQGTFLFVFDLGFYLIQNNHGKELLKFVDQLAINPTGVQFTFYL